MQGLTPLALESSANHRHCNPSLVHADSAAEIYFSKKFTRIDLYLVSSGLLVGPFFSPCNLFWCIWAHFVHLTHACSHFSKHIPSKLIYCSSWKESSWFGVFFPHLALEPEPSAMVLCGVIQAPFSFPGFTFGNYPFSSTTVSIESISERYDIHISYQKKEDPRGRYIHEYRFMLLK